MKCPKCDKKLSQRRDVHFDHELICYSCCETHNPKEWEKMGAMDNEQLKLKIHELTAERNELLKLIKSIAVTVNNAHIQFRVDETNSGSKCRQP